MAANRNIFQLPTPVKNAILSKRCIAFIGSGPSTSSYKSWDKLVDDLCKYCGCNSRVTRDSTGEALLDAAQDAKNTDKMRYYSFLGQHFGRWADSASLLYDALLALPFECYLTINLDPLLALKSRTARNPCNSVRAYPALDRKNMKPRSIHYLHGRIDEGTTPKEDSIVLSRDEFDTAYALGSNLMNLLLPTLENDPIVFIGCRLREPDIKKVFGVCKDLQLKRIKAMARLDQPCGTPPSRYILLPEPVALTADGAIDESQMSIAKQREESFYKGMDITPFWYPVCESDHSALRLALDGLAELPTFSPNYGWEGDGNAF